MKKVAIVGVGETKFSGPQDKTEVELFGEAAMEAINESNLKPKDIKALFVGNVLGDFLSGWGFWWSWDVGNGLMGFIPGLIAASVVDFRDLKTILKAELFVILGAVIGMGFSSLMEIPLYGLDFKTAVTGYWVPAGLDGMVMGLILVPILMVAYDAVLKRRGR